MTSFGFSLGDIAVVGTYAYNVYKSCQNAGEAFATITTDVNSMRSLLSTLTDESTNPKSSLQRLSPAQQGELKVRLDECKSDLREVKKILHQYKSLDTKDPRFRDRLAFTTGKQAALRERISTHSERIQQFLGGINIATFSRIESNTEAQLVSLSEILARLEQMHHDLLSGKQDPSILQGISAVTAVEKEILRDDVTASDVDLSHVVSQWLVEYNLETPKVLESSASVDDFSSEGSAFSVRGTADNAPQGEEFKTRSPAGDRVDAFFPGLRLFFPASPLPETRSPSYIPSAFVDVRPLVPQVVPTPHRLSHYLPPSKKCTKSVKYIGRTKETLQAIFVRIELSQQEWEQGTKKIIEVKRNVFKKDVQREEMNTMVVMIDPQKVQLPLRFLFPRLGNRTVRDSRLIRGLRFQLMWRM